MNPTYVMLWYPYSLLCIESAIGNTTLTLKKAKI